MNGNQAALHFVLLNNIVDLFVVNDVVVELLHREYLFDLSELLLQKGFDLCFRIALRYMG